MGFLFLFSNSSSTSQSKDPMSFEMLQRLLSIRIVTLNNYMDHKNNRKLKSGKVQIIKLNVTLQFSTNFCWCLVSCLTFRPWNRNVSRCFFPTSDTRLASPRLIHDHDIYIKYTDTSCIVVYVERVRLSEWCSVDNTTISESQTVRQNSTNEI